MAKMAQIDFTPATHPQGLYVHVPVGASASGSNDPSKFPALTKKPAVTVSVVSPNGYAVLFSNPS